MPNRIPARSRKDNNRVMNTCHHHPPAPPKKAQFLVDNLLGLGLLGGGTTLSETVLESSVDVLEVSHSAGTAKKTMLNEEWERARCK